MRNVPNDYAARVIAIRAALRLRQADLSARMEVSQLTVSRWENGHSRPQVAHWHRLMALSVDVDVDVVMATTPVPRGAADGRRGQRAGGRRLAEPTTEPRRTRTVPCPCCGAETRSVNGAWLRWLRLRAGLSQDAAARTMGISGPYLSDLETNRRVCPPTILQAYRAMGGTAMRDVEIVAGDPET